MEKAIGGISREISLLLEPQLKSQVMLRSTLSDNFRVAKIKDAPAFMTLQQ